MPARMNKRLPDRYIYRENRIANKIIEVLTFKKNEHEKLNQT